MGLDKIMNSASKKAKKDRKKTKKQIKNEGEVKSGNVNKRKNIFQKILTGTQSHEVLRSYESYPELVKIKAHEKYVFHSDYFKIDDYYASILMFKHRQGAMDRFGPFWGVNMIPYQLPRGVTTMNVDSVVRMGQGWIDAHQPRAENISSKNSMAQHENGTLTEKTKARRSQQSLAEIAQELTNGASYLNVQNRLLVKAPTLDMLDEAIHKIEREYTDNFGTLNPGIYNGRQYDEFSHLLGWNKAKHGKGFYYTSTEYAGAYNLVTHGLEDPGGEYVGYMTGDVNNSAVLFNVDGFRHHVVIATNQFNDDIGKRQHVSDLWGMKLAQSALLNGHRVVHLVLDSESDLDKIAPPMKDITYKIDMNHGDVNMFEMFGKREDELAIFANQMTKLKLMAEQAYHPTDSDKSIIESSLEDILTDYYIKNQMWVPDAKNHRNLIKLVGLPHYEYPKLELFVSYLAMYRQKTLNLNSKDSEAVHAANTLNGIFTNLLSSNGDLFNTTTSSNIDGVVNGRRVVYDFSDLRRRGIGVAMAQLVNILNYAVSTLGNGDLVIIHGADQIDDGIKEYCRHQFDQLFDRGGRVAYLYNDIDSFLRDDQFNKYDEADYTIVGNMAPKRVDEYQKKLGSTIPMMLRKLITNHAEAINYIHRGTSNVVFKLQLPLRPSREDYGFRQRKRYN